MRVGSPRSWAGTLCTLALLSAFWILLPVRTYADVERFALIVGNNSGMPGDEPLRYAESDARRVYDVLTQIGDFSPINSVLLRGSDATELRSALLTINERIRDSAARPDTRVVLVVYYSGHADARSLHLRGTELPISELSQMARGSAANFRLVVLDACRSGTLTRVKGGQRVAPFALPTVAEESLPEDGFAFLTASAANEDAQESDELQGGLFTHAFVSALLGAADADGDGAIVLDEAYRYAYEATLRTTSRTLVGTQHPTFQYALRGRGHLVLTRPRAHALQRANVNFPSGLSFLLLRENASGAVAVELTTGAEQRTLSLEPGRYFLRARAPDVMYEGLIEAASGSSRSIDLQKLERIDYARLARKGPEASPVHGLLAGLMARAPLPNASTSCLGGFAGYQVDASRFGARARFASCVSELQTRTLRATVLGHDMLLYGYHAWDLSFATIELGVGTGLSLFAQQFETRGSAPTQRMVAPFTVIGVGSEIGLGRGFYASLQAHGETHFLRIRERSASAKLEVGFTVRPTLGLGKHF